MISPHTAPGTKVVCVNDALGVFDLPCFEYEAPVDFCISDGEIYTVIAIYPCDDCKSFFAVELAEVDRGYVGADNGFDIARFRYLDLPKSITSLLDVAPVDLEVAQ